jgi:hypothetical protein
MLDKSLPLLLEHCAVSKRERIWRNLWVYEKSSDQRWYYDSVLGFGWHQH